MRLQSGRHLGGSVAASLCLLAMLALPLNASAETWWRASNRHFDLFTTGSVAESKQALAALEAAQSYFSQSGELPFSDEKVLKVVAFHSTEEYASFRLHKAAFGHYLKGAKQDFVVLSDIHPEHRDALIHEYTHSVVRQAGYNLPLWLNEGIADLYSSLAFSGNLVKVGLPLPTRLRTIEHEGLIPLSRLFAATRESSHSDESHTLSGFYAESWALTHMLKFDPAYSAGFTRFLAVTAKGFDGATALKLIFGKEVRQVEADLISYLPSLAGMKGFEVPIQLQASSNTVAQISEEDGAFLLAGMLAEQSWTRAAAEEKTRALARQYPKRAEPEATLAELLWKQGKAEDARAYLTHAIALDNRQAGMIYRLAEMERETGASDEQLIARLRQVIALEPGHPDANFNLAVLEFNEHRFAEAREALAALKNVRPEWASTYYCMAAYCELHARNVQRAHDFGNMAKQRAVTADEKAHADQLLQRLATLGG